MHGAVQLQHLPAARRLMQPVDILRQHTVQLSGSLQPGQRDMRGIGPGIGIEHHVFVERPELVR